MAGATRLCRDTKSVEPVDHVPLDPAAVRTDTMSVRMASGDAALWQVVLGMSMTVVAIVGLTWLAGRVYANSALRLGARVRFWDALRG
jgi:hypothetical protein